MSREKFTVASMFKPVGSQEEQMAAIQARENAYIAAAAQGAKRKQRVENARSKANKNFYAEWDRWHPKPPNHSNETPEERDIRTAAFMKQWRQEQKQRKNNENDYKELDRIAEEKKAKANINTLVQMEQDIEKTKRDIVQVEESLAQQQQELSKEPSYTYKHREISDTIESLIRTIPNLKKFLEDLESKHKVLSEQIGGVRKTRKTRKRRHTRKHKRRS